MKKTVFIITLLLIVSLTASSQYRVVPNKPYSVLKSNPGFVSINEFNGGFGLGSTALPDSKSLVGFTTVFAYQMNVNLTAGVGTGLLFYDTNLMVPLYLDFRYFFMSGQFTPFIYGDGGLMLKVSDFNGSKLFINPGAGVRYSLSRKIAANASIGAISQADGTNRSTFVNFKAGVVYVF
jgi:hypothetical protein